MHRINLIRCIEVVQSVVVDRVPVAPFPAVRDLFRNVNQALVAQGLATRDLRGLVVLDADLYAADMPDCDFCGSTLSPLAARKASLDRSLFDGASLPHAHMDLVSARHTSWRGASLRDAYLSRVDLTGADLTGCDLRGAYIIGCIFDRAQLRGADFRRARVEGCHWRRCHTLRHTFGLPPMRALMRPR